MPEKIKILKFQCGACGHNQLECVESDVFYYSPIADIKEDGDFDYGEARADGGMVDHYECCKCGEGLIGEDGIGEDGEFLTEHSEVVEWCKKNCKQD